MDNYLSCNYIQGGISFYPNDIIKICCFSSSEYVNACKTFEPIEVIIKKIFIKKASMIHDFRGGNIYTCCKNCSCLVEREWGSTLRQINRVTLNHFMFCNLKCGHCGYAREMKKTPLIDTDHGRVLEIIKELKSRNILSSNVYCDVGGGEPSVSQGVLEIVQYFVRNNNRVHINSNGARYVDSIAEGVNSGLIDLTLTPDAGSREIYKIIKGRDYFIQTWRNIERYCRECSQNVQVKFILQDKNLEDISSMIEMCNSVGVNKVALSLDLNIKEERRIEYAYYIDKFRELAENNKLTVYRSLVPDKLWR